jgi:lipid A 3-O-deacylase
MVFFTHRGSLPAFAQQSTPRYGIALLTGQAFDPDHFGLLILQGNVKLPYDQVFWHNARDSLFFQGELNFGLTIDGRERTLAAVNMMAVQYLQAWTYNSLTPYIEGGIGLIYTDFKIEGQGLRFNLNPQIGAGVEFTLERGRLLRIGVRLHHLSNGGLHRDNRGMNSVLLQVGTEY